MTTPQATISVKKPGPPVPPRPQHTTAAAGLLKTQRESAMNVMNRVTATTAATSSANTAKIVVATAAGEQQQHQQHNNHPVIQKKPILPTQNGASGGVGVGVGVGRTVIYKSSSVNLLKKHEEQQQRKNTTTARTPGAAQKPPLKLRKAPDVPTIKPRANNNKDDDTSTTATTSGNSPTVKASASFTTVSVNRIHGTPPPTPSSTSNNSTNNNGIVIVQSSNGVSLNRHHSMGSPKTPAGLKETRLSLSRADFENVGKIQLDQLQPGLPLPKPRKIVKMPVATLDMDDKSTRTSTQHTSGGVSIFRRSKTTLDSFTARANVTTINTGSGGNGSSSTSSGGSGGGGGGGSVGFLTGKTAEIKNNLKNAAERLFSEIIVNQQKHVAIEPATIITKHERAVQHQALLEQELAEERQKRMKAAQMQLTEAAATTEGEGVVASAQTVTVASNAVATTTTATPQHKEAASNYTRININATSKQMTPSPVKSMLKSPEKKTAFHEILISELAAMRGKSVSMENLPIKDMRSEIVNEATPQIATTAAMAATPSKVNMCNKIASTTPTTTPTRQRCNSVEDHDPDTDDHDVDADNIEDAEGDEDDLSKTLKSSSNSSQRKRCPSGCSSDSSPYGTERSARIRTSDWIEVGDNGKEVTLTSCHISLEDSGLEDEERLDDMSSSGVGDSWDSVKEAESVTKRCRNVKRVLSITDLPPLPKSLSGINKMLGSDSGLISDVDAKTESNNNKKLVCQEDNSAAVADDNSSNINSNSKNINNHENENDKTTIEESNGNVNDNESTTTIASTSTITPPMAAETDATTLAATTTTTTTLPGPGTTLDTQLAILRKEMYGLRQLDLSLLSQLWALNDSIQEFRVMIEEQDEDQESYSPHSPTPSSYDSASSDGEDDNRRNSRKNNNINKNMMDDEKPKIITTQPKLTKSSSTDITTNIKSLSENQHHYQHPQTRLTHSASSASSSSPPLQLQRQKPTVPKPLEMKPVPRMRSAPPPPPVSRKAAAPPRPT